MMNIRIETGNAAFTDEYTGKRNEITEGVELNRILRKIIRDIDAGRTSGKCVDINGNVVGEWSR